MDYLKVQIINPTASDAPLPVQIINPALGDDAIVGGVTADEKAALDSAPHALTALNPAASVADLPVVPMAAYVNPATATAGQVATALINAGLMASH